MALLRPEVLADLCHGHPRRKPSDLAASWHNAPRWFLQLGVSPEYLQPGREPAEITGARTLFVHWVFEEFPEDKANYNFVMYQLLSPYTARARGI